MNKKNRSKDEIKAFADYIVEVLDNKKGRDIELIDVSEQSSLADYFILATGNSSSQVKALADEVEFQVKEKYEIDPKYSEGYGSREWILLDYLDVIVHVFNQESRDYYQLDKLWR